jgi:sulfatase modifying factor 1
MTESNSACCPLDGERSAEKRTMTGVKRDEDYSIGNDQPETQKVSETPDRMVKLPGGTFTMGTDDDIGFPEDGENPTREVTIDPFYIDQHAVTNAEFLQFVRDTGYTTEAEEFGWSFVFQDFLPEGAKSHVLRSMNMTPWWLAVEEACWYQPTGPGSSIKDQLAHPVVQISYRDALAYCEWAGKRLPTEAEWEYAARGGLEQKRFPWGNELKPNSDHLCNIWQGSFPTENTGKDGYLYTAPVDAFEPNGYGLYNVSGNVWEWCADWFSSDYHTTDEYDYHNPTGPQEGQNKVLRGGSYLCHHSYCNRYRVAARSSNPPDSGAGNNGFRCVVDMK